MRVPLVPVTVTDLLPVVLNVHERVDVPLPPVTVVGERVHDGLSLAKATSALKAFNGVIVIVDVPVAPTRIVTAVGLAPRLKSGTIWTVKATVVRWVRVPLVPVTVTVTGPAFVKVHDRAEVPEPPVTEAGERLQLALSLDKATFPVNPFNGVMVMVEVPAAPTVTVTLVGLAAMSKSLGGTTL